MRKSKYEVYGPVRDGMFTCWQVRGPRGGKLGDFLTKRAAQEFIKQKGKMNHGQKQRIAVQDWN